MKNKLTLGGHNDHNFSDSDFHKSSFSGVGGNWGCVEVASDDKMVAVRNTTDPDKTTVVYTHEEWRAFIKGAKNGEFNI